MENSVIRKSIMTFMSAVLAVSLVPVMTLSQKADAATNSGNATTSELATSDNTSMADARTLGLGKSAIVTFDEEDAEDEDAVYWYKFRTSARNSAYKIRVASIDGGNASRVIMDGDGSALLGGRKDLTKANPIRTDYFRLRSSADKSSWVYINIQCSEDNSDFGDRFSVSVVELPVLRKVAGIRSYNKMKHSFSLKWGKESYATRYQIKYRVRGGKWRTSIVKKNHVRLHYLKRGRVYTIQIRSYHKGAFDYSTKKACNWSSWSSPIKVKTRR